MARGWNAYWFGPAPYVDLAMVRIWAVGCQLLKLLLSPRNSSESFEALASMPDALYDSITVLKLMLVPFGWDYRPTADVLELVRYVSIFAGVTALIGFRTCLSLWVLLLGNVFIVSVAYSHGDFHHTEAPLIIALGRLAMSPSARVLSVDQWLGQGRGAITKGDLLTAESPFAGWPIRLIQWLFVLFYLSAIMSKLVFEGGPSWLNGYTLQYYLIQDTLKKGTLLGGWFAQQHMLVLLSQWVVVCFQITFALCVVFPVALDLCAGRTGFPRRQLDISHRAVSGVDGALCRVHPLATRL